MWVCNIKYALSWFTDGVMLPVVTNQGIEYSMVEFYHNMFDFLKNTCNKHHISLYT